MSLVHASGDCEINLLLDGVGKNLLMVQLLLVKMLLLQLLLLLRGEVALLLRESVFSLLFRSVLGWRSLSKRGLRGRCGDCTRGGASEGCTELVVFMLLEC